MHGGDLDCRCDPARLRQSDCHRTPVGVNQRDIVIIYSDIEELNDLTRCGS